MIHSAPIWPHLTRVGLPLLYTFADRHALVYHPAVRGPARSTGPRTWGSRSRSHRPGNAAREGRLGPVGRRELVEAVPHRGRLGRRDSLAGIQQPDVQVDGIIPHESGLA